MGTVSSLMPPLMLASALSYSVVASITPGPNNLMLTASGVNFGLRRTVPHMAGISAGYAATQILTGFGLGGLFHAFPAFRLALEIVEAAATLWLAWKIATGGGPGGAAARPHPMRFWAAFAFQAVNPKVWIVAISAIALFVPFAHVTADVLFIAALLAVVNVPCMLVWAGFGAGLGDFLKVPARLRLFNIVMGLALAASTLVLLRG